MENNSVTTIPQVYALCVAENGKKISKSFVDLVIMTVDNTLVLAINTGSKTTPEHSLVQTAYRDHKGIKFNAKAFTFDALGEPSTYYLTIPENLSHLLQQKK